MAAIRSAGESWQRAFSAGDADRLAALYADSAVLMPESAASVNGRNSIRVYLASSIARHSAAGYVLAIPPDGDADAAGDLGYRSGTYSVRDGTGAVVDSGKWVQVWTKEGGEWRILKDIRNSDSLPLWIGDDETE